MEEGKRKNALWKICIVLMCIGLLGACASPRQHVKRELSEDEHSFSSSANPHVRLTLPTSWEYFGKVEEAEYDAGIGTAVKALSYFWGSPNEKSISEGFLVRVLTISGSEDLRWDEQIFAGAAKQLESGTVEIEGESYEYLSTIFPDPLTGYEERFITNAGYALPHFFLVYALGQLDPRQKMKSYFLYFQHIDPAKFNGFLKKFISDEWDEKELNEDEKQMLEEFLGQFRKNITFQPLKK